MHRNRYNVLGTTITVCDYRFVLEQVKKKHGRRNVLLAPIASQVIVKALLNKKLRDALHGFDHLFMCSEWLKRSVEFLYAMKIPDRVYGPQVMQIVCQFAEEKGYKIFLYGTSENTLKKLKKRLLTLYPNLSIAGSLPSRFKPFTDSDKEIFIRAVEKSKATIIFIGISSPLQEVIAYETFHDTSLIKPVVVIPVGSAFDYISGVKQQAPVCWQKNGMEWLFRLKNEPRRLWKRYLIFGPAFIFLVMLQKLVLLNFSHRKIFKKIVTG